MLDPFTHPPETRDRLWPGLMIGLLAIVLLTSVAIAFWNTRSAIAAVSDLYAHPAAPASEPFDYESLAHGYAVEFPGAVEENYYDVTVDGVEVPVDEVLWKSLDGIMYVQTTDLRESEIDTEGDVYLGDTWDDMVAATTDVTGGESYFLEFAGEAAVSGTVETGDELGGYSGVILMHDGVEYRMMSTFLDEDIQQAFFDSFAFVE